MSAAPVVALLLTLVGLPHAPGAAAADMRPQVADSATAALLAAGDSAGAVDRLAAHAEDGDASAALLLLEMGPRWYGSVLPKRELLERGARGALERIAFIERRLLEDVRASRPDPRTGAPAPIEAPPALIRERTALAEVLEQSVVRAPWGDEELARLASMYPGSPILARFGVRRALHEHDAVEALRRVEPLIGESPRDADLHTMRATALEIAGDAAAARRAWGVTFELSPADPVSFGALLRLHREDDSLPTLLDRVRRLRRTYPHADVLIEREVELLHRLGRSEEAARVRRGGAS